MIHRPDRCNPDLDDRLLQPNEARAASNLRMAASIDSTNLGITTVNGMALLEYEAPSGDNQIVGIREDYETQYVYFALFNNDSGTHDHGIWRTNGLTVDRILHGSILNFQEDGDVSIAIIDGKIYLTDNVNQPRMCSIQKGIDEDYPDPLEEWMITQIKRPPGVAPYVGTKSGITLIPPAYTLEEISDDYDNLIKVPEGIQIASFYIYDNDEESRLSPYSDIVFNITDLVVQVQIPEFNAYLSGKNLVSEVVFCYRRGNEGLWNVFKRVANTVPNQVLSNQAAFGGDIGSTLEALIPDVNFLPVETVSASITNADFDAAPLLAATLEVAQNRLDLADVLMDYPQWTGLTLALTAVNKSDTVLTGDAALSGLTFRPAGRYQVGVEILDEWQRRIGVVAVQTVTFPDYEIWNQDFFQDTPTVDVFGLDNTYWYRDENNRYELDYELTGTLPSWASYYRIVRSKEQTASFRYRTVGRLYTWYLKDTADDVLVVQAESPPEDRLVRLGLSGGTTPFYFKGYAMELTMGEPVEFTSGSKLYVKIIGAAGNPTLSAQENFGIEFEVVKQTNNVFYFKFNDSIGSDANLNILDGASPENRQFSCFFDVEFYFKTSAPDANFYQTQYSSIRPIADFVSGETGTLQGDSYLTKYKKINQAIKKTAYIITDVSLIEFEQTGNPENIYGAAISMNPIDLYNQLPESSIGQANVINEQQEQTRLPNVIIFTDPIIIGSRNNGLNKFNSIDNRQAPLENGPITALVRTSATQREPGVLLAIGTNGVSSFYYDGIQLTNVDGTANVSTSDKYLASQRPLVGNYGAQKLRNVCVTPLGTVYFWSENIKDWIRYTNAGLDQLGEIYGFMNYQRNQLSDSTEIMMTYDQVTDEAIMIGNASDALIFSERYKTFQGSREYLVDEIRPERGASIATRTFLFRQGHVWQMGPGVSVDDNSFFGELKDPTLTIVTNPEPMTVKRWNQIRMFGPLPSSTIMRSEPQEGTQDDTLVSHIDEGWWIQRKSNFDAAIRTAEDGDGEVLNGRIMESRLLISTFVWPAGSFVKLNYIEVKATRAPVQ